MEYREARAYLESVRMIDVKLRLKEQELKKLREDIVSISAIDCTKDKISTSKIPDLSDKIVKLEECTKLIYRDWDILIEEREKCRELINRLDDELEKSVLMLRYVNCRKWEQICVDLNFSWQHIMRVHKCGIRSLSKI